MRRSSSRLFSGRKSTPRTRAKIAAFAPMPSARVRITVTVRPLARPRERRAYFRSPAKSRMASNIMMFPSEYGARAVYNSMSYVRPGNRHVPELFFVFGKQVAQAVERPVPVEPALLDPLRGHVESGRVQVAGAYASHFGGLYQAGFFQHLQVLYDGS